MKRPADSRDLPSGRFLGRIGRQLEGSLGLCTEVWHDPHAVYPAHRHGAAHVCFVVEGEFVERDRSGERRCRPGTLVFAPSAAEHAQRIGGRGARCLGVELAPNSSGTPCRDHAPRLVRSGRLLGLLARLHERLGVARARSHASSAEVDELLMHCVRELRRLGTAGRTRPEQPWLRHVTGLLEREYAHPPSLRMLAYAAELHPVHLSQAYRRTVGMTLRETVRQRRVEVAARLLLSGGGTRLSDIACRTGFADQSHFTRVFKAAVGLTPGRFRTLFLGVASNAAEGTEAQ